jgi:hypothetical protein
VTEHRRAQARLEQRIGLLRSIEAVRLYAAEHGGHPPDRLNAVALPLPVDPFTGKAFEYAVDGGTVKLAGTGRRYEVRLAATQRGARK